MTNNYFVACDYFEYSPEGEFLGENTDNCVAEFATLPEAQAYRLELFSEEAVTAAWVCTLEDKAIKTVFPLPA